MFETLDELGREYPERHSSSPAAAKVAEAIKAHTAALKLETITEKIKVYRFQNSLLAFGLGSIAAVFVGFNLPQLGFIIQSFLWVLLVGELKLPVLAKFNSGKAENIVVTIPARSKETQKAVLTAAYDTSGLLAAPLGLKPKLYWILNIIIGLTVPVLQLLGLLLNLPALMLGSLLPISVMLVIGLLPKQSEHRPGLTGCKALLETASILTRFRPAITTVIIYFTGAQSLNSSVQKIPTVFKGENPTYGLNLVEQNRQGIGVISREGLLPRSGSPLITEILTEVAGAKSIPIEPIITSEITPSYPFSSKKTNVVSLAVPTQDTNENLRELLVGFIRKIEH